MTYFHYYATTSRNLDRVVQYGLFPLAHMVGYELFANKKFTSKEEAEPALRMAANFARGISTLGYALLTTAFFGFESEMIDANSREAVATEMGIDPTKVTFSDYKYSQNRIVSKAYDDIMRLQKYRYGTDMMFLIPTILHPAAEKIGIEVPRMKEVREHPWEHSFPEKFTNGHNAWDMGVYGGKALYWAGETFMIPKTGNYEVVKLRENLQSTGRDVSVGDLLSVYQRTRMDRKLPRIENDSAKEYDAIRPLLEKMAEAYNKHDGKFGISEIVYLIGMNKVNIHDTDNKTVSQEAVARSMAEIDKVLAVGLKGIREENRKARVGRHMPAKHAKGLRDRVANTAYNTIQKILGNDPIADPKLHTEEYVTIRDPGELTNWNYSINR